MIRLLVSVRNAEEAEAALQGGCDLVDVKEPEHGPLGMASPATIAAVVFRVAGWNMERRTHVAASIALGDALDWATQPAPVLPAVEYVKLGTAGLYGADWTLRWKAAMTHAMAHCGGSPQTIVVAYADWRKASAPPVTEVVSAARDLGCAGVLIDTFDKRLGWLGAELEPQSLQELALSAGNQGLLFAVAGGLRVDRLDLLTGIAVDFVGIRGAACRDGLRTAAVDADIVSEFAAELRRQTESM